MALNLFSRVAIRQTTATALRSSPAATTLISRHLTTPADQHFHVTATGRDRAGVVTQIAKAILGEISITLIPF